MSGKYKRLDYLFITICGVCWYYIACSPEKGMVPGVERLPCIGV